MSRKVFAARTASAPKRKQADREQRPGRGRAGVRHARHEPRHEHADEADGDDRIATTAATSAITNRGSSGAVDDRRASRARARRAPTGSVAAPVSAMTPLLPTSTPGVTSPCTASSAAMIVKPPAMTTVRASPRRAPIVIRRAPRRRGQRADADAVEVHPQRRHHHHAAAQPEREDREQRHPDEEADPGDRQVQPHPDPYRHDRERTQAPDSGRWGSQRAGLQHRAVDDPGRVVRAPRLDPEVVVPVEQGPELRRQPLVATVDGR